MRILVIDDDDIEMPQTCDLLKLEGHEVLQIKDSSNIEESIKNFAPDGIILDLMIPDLNLPQKDINGGYTTGAYLYKNVINKIAHGIPFVVYSGTAIEVDFIKEDLDSLKAYEEYSGTIEKGDDEDLILKYLLGHRKKGG